MNVRSRCTMALLVLLPILVAPTAIVAAQGQPDPTAIIAEQIKAMERLRFMDGVWRGPASTVLPSGEKHEITQTERIGPFLGGSVKVIEGRGYGGDGKVAFNALAVVSFSPATQTYTMRSYAMGNVGDFVFQLTESGYTWEIPAGRMTIRYTAVVKDGTWHEVGDRIVGDGEPIRFFEMTLRRVGDTDWPSAGAIGPE